MASQTLRNKRADREYLTAEEHLELLHKDFPDYDRWTIEDFKRFDPRDIEIIRTVIAAKVGDVDVYVPQSFKDQYKEYANAVFMQAIFREGNHRKLDDGVARRLLKSFYGQDLPNDKFIELEVKQDSQVTLNSGMTIKANTAEIFSYAMARELERGNNTITVPKDVAISIVNANSQLLDQRLANVGLQFIAGDEAACDSGYFSRLGLGSTIGSSNVSYDPKNFNFDKFDSFIQDIYNPQKPDKKVNEAWQACWILADMDVQTGDAIARESKPPKTPDLSYANKAANTR